MKLAKPLTFLYSLRMSMLFCRVCGSLGSSLESFAAASSASSLALPLLFEQISARFAREGSAAVFAFGWREPSKRTKDLRVVFVPGDDGDVGELAVARQPGRLPRPLATLEELVTVYLEAFDPSSAENELVQYTSARLLFDAFTRALYHAARGTFSMRSIRWVDNPNERRHGATMRLVIALDAMVPDLPASTVAPTVSENETAVLTATNTDSTEDAP